MNKFFLILSVCLFSSTVFSLEKRWFYQPMNCYTTGYTSNCVTTNYRFKPIFCQAYAQAQTFTGKTISNYFEGWIEVRESGIVNIKATEDDLIVNVSTSARCLF